MGFFGMGLHETTGSCFGGDRVQGRAFCEVVVRWWKRDKVVGGVLQGEISSKTRKKRRRKNLNQKQDGTVGIDEQADEDDLSLWGRVDEGDGTGMVEKKRRDGL
ncbi:hypothetical protein OIU74_013815 [Salix koriyanagi]|uniref:Uncharacterized protein n=1 Tax=Salix koriyanagi TaxID=2511006 RepID=A0A9Q0PUI8_9ROSI|nr:hypothetical protein OIU74_013815 [Salix koriyanagi]